MTISNLIFLIEAINSNSIETQTPLDVVDQMINNIPIEYFSNPNIKFLDPCCGTGKFLLRIIEKLDVGLIDVITDPKVRRRHILENQIWAFDISEVQIMIFKSAISRLNWSVNEETINYNIYNCDFINLKQGNNMKFDVIIGNPPYQDDNKEKGENGRKQSSSKIWPIFCKKSINDFLKDNGHLLFIIPASSLKGTRLTGFNFKKTFGDYLGKKITIGTDSWFENISTKNIFFHLQKTKRNNLNDLIEIEYYNKNMELEHNINIKAKDFIEEISFIPMKYSKSCNVLNIVSKVFNSKYENLFNEGCGGISAKKEIDKNIDIDLINGEVYLGGGNIGANSIIIKKALSDANILQTKEKNKRGYNIKKLIWPVGCADNPIFHADFNGNLIVGTSASFTCLESNWTLEGMKSVLRSKLFVFLIRDLRFDGYVNHMDYLPKVDMSKVYTDDEVCDLFNLSIDEKKYINSIATEKSVGRKKKK